MQTNNLLKFSLQEAKGRGAPSSASIIEYKKTGA